jgi:glucose/arabinose dehydrogenase
MRTRLKVVRLLLSMTLLVLPFSVAAQSLDAYAVPAGFTDQVLTSVTEPVALAFTPDGRLLITTKPGRLFVYDSRTRATTLALDLSAFSCHGKPGSDERGMLGVAPDPAFASNNFVYVYYTASPGGTCKNRVSRFTLPSSDVIDRGSELILLDNFFSAIFHQGGDLQFGRDGFLYVSVGDAHSFEGSGKNNHAAQDLGVPNGKILRITTSGAPAPGNPFMGAGSVRCGKTGGTVNGPDCQEIYAYGFRNPFRISLDPNSSGTRILVDDVGENTTEEIDVLQEGGNFGWPMCEGPCGRSGLIDPVFSYSHSGGGGAITGGAIVPNGIGWPAPYPGAYLFGDYVRGNIFRVTPSGGRFTGMTTFTSGPSAVDLVFGPNGTCGQALYFDGLGGSIHKVVGPGGTGNCNPPVASFTTSPGPFTQPDPNNRVSYCSTQATVAGAPPFTVAFDGSGSQDPNGLALTYQWNFGDGSTQTTTGPKVSHTYTKTGAFTASLVVRNSQGQSSTNPASTSIHTDAGLPHPTISSPATTATFKVGGIYTPSGGATDSSGHAIPASGLSWQVWLFHNYPASIGGHPHVHPVLDPTKGTGNPAFTAPPAEQFSGIAGGSRLLICLSATDSHGVTQTIEQDFNPHVVPVTFATSPAGLQVHIAEDDVDAGGNVTGPTTVNSWEGYQLDVTAPNQGSNAFQSWSDGGAQTHAIATPAAATTYTATFGACTSGCGATIGNLSVKDTANAANWSIQSNLQPGQRSYGDRTYTWRTVSNLAGSSWIRTAGNSKTFKGNPLVTFTVGNASTVYVGMDRRAGRPAWLDSTWTDTRTTLTGSTGITYEVFSKQFAAGSTVSLGPQGAASASSAVATYTVIVK